jgi:hypothetical protein
MGEPKNLVPYVTTDGTFVRTIDISAASPHKPAGLAIAPGSKGSSDPTPTIKNLYVADRGVDNNSNASENDGKIYELSIPGTTSGNQPPTVGAGTDQIIDLPANGGPASTNLDGNATDDGLPNPPASVTTTWSKVNGPGTVTFGNPNLVDTTASFTTDGLYALPVCR